MATSSFTCPHGHSWTAPRSGVSLIGGKFVACPVCAALVKVEGGGSTVEGTDPQSLMQPPTVDSVSDIQATQLQAQLETWRKMPPVEIKEIGDYDILSELGRGGMGVVYRAKHRKLKRQAALKMILAGEFASGDSLRRFQAEAEAVARMQHPNIVQIYDIGEHAKKPWFAMEFCDGGCLHDRLDTPLAPKQAAEMMVKIARGMHFAHQQGIVHRDLKPANILLTRGQQPKITDFGLAKKLDDEKGKTRTGDVLGTPSYMAPEQAEGRIKDIGAHTDVYSLGTILYEMLTARQAFQAETAMDTLFQVLYEEPVAPARLVPRTPRDLETICLKCMSKEIGKRYGSAEELALDLERYLNGQPIVARPAGAVEKTIKWIKRRPAAAALIGVSALAAVGVLGMSLYFNVELTQAAQEARESEKKALDNEKKAKDNEKLAKDNEKLAKDNEKLANQQKDRAITAEKVANANFQKARAVVQSMLTEVGHSNLKYVPLMEPIRRKLLMDALQFNKEFLAQQGDDPEVGRQAALSHQHLADIHKMLGDYTEANKENLEAIRQLRELADNNKEQPEYRQDLATSYFHRGQLWNDQGRYADAEAAFLESRQLREALVQLDSARAEYRRELGRTYTELGQVLRDTARPADAEQSFLRSLELHRQLVQEQPDNPDYRDGLGGTLTDLGTLLRQTKRLDEAEKVYRQAIAHFQDMVRRWPTQGDFRRKQAAAWNNLGNVFQDRQNYPEAVTNYKQALAERQKLADQFPSVLQYRQDLAGTHNNLASALMAAGEKQAEAEQELEESVRIYRKLHEDLPAFPDYQSQLGAVLDNLAAISSRQGQPAKARKRLDEAQSYHEMARKTNPTQPQYRQFFRNHYSILADALVRQSESGGGNSHREAATAVAEMLKLKADSADDFLRAGVLLARCVPLAEKDKGITNGAAVAQKYGADAVGYLREAVKRGLADPGVLKNAPQLNALRTRDDFKKLIAELP